MLIARMVIPGAVQQRLGNAGGARKLELRGSRGHAVSAFLVPDPVSSQPQREGTLVFVGATLRKGGLFRVGRIETCRARSVTGPLDATTGGATWTFDASKQGGLPHAIRFTEAGPTKDVQPVTSFAWNDRVHHAQRGGWLLRNDRAAKLTVLVETPQLTVVRVTARYCSGDGTPEPGGAMSVYDWYLFRSTPRVLVQSFVEQRDAQEWHELHHLEFNFPDTRFVAWAGGGAKGEVFRADKKAWQTTGWGALLDGETGKVRSVLAILAPVVRFYDGRGEYGTYIHGLWDRWSTRHRLLTAWLWVGTSQAPEEVLAREAALRSSMATFTTEALERRIAVLASRERGQWTAAVAERLLARGELEMAEKVARAGTTPSASLTGLVMGRAGDAGLALRVMADGVRIHSFYDHRARKELAADKQPPLVRVLLRRTSDGATEEVTSDSGWTGVECNRLPNGTLSLRLHTPADKRFTGLRVVASTRPDPIAAAWRWSLRVENSNTEWGIERVAFPQIAVLAPDENTVAFYPTGAGVLTRLHRGSSIQKESLYPNGWCTMQYMAVYSDGRGIGMYAGLHDPAASTKSLVMSSDDGSAVTLSFDSPVPDMGKPGTTFAMPGEGVWQVLRGDWYDAARIYRAWIRKSARWFPKLGPNGRLDTPTWMKELCAWAQTGGAPAECVAAVKSMQQALGVPIGFHWYNWHEIPFDNDYPHYFPTKTGVAEAVSDLQSHNVFVMPYINGRLWDTRDRGTEDYEFTSKALPAATKDRAGAPYVETYGSKEADGSPVRLAVMCPTTRLWQDTIRAVVLQLMTEVGTKAVYIDQISAAPPVLCMDPSHGHPLGGGSWWTVDGYWPFLRAIRSAMPPDRMITSECAAEPYAGMLDGQLSWEWQYDGMVPALPAVYGGAVQYFGRNYGAGASTRDLALCMKMGQQLVYGEQIGWLDPRISTEAVAGAFLRLVVRTRHRFVRYFAAGEMARPPKLQAGVPSVRADWAWYGETWVTTPAVLTGAWVLPHERRLLLLFVNVSDREVRTAYQWDATAYGISSRSGICAVVRDPDGAPESQRRLASRARIPLVLGPRSLEAWEVRW